MKKKMTKSALCKITGLSKSLIENICLREGISDKNQDKFEDLAARIIEESSIYISFNQYSKSKDGSRFTHSNWGREKLLNQLKINDYYGLEVFPAENLIIGKKADIVFFRRADIPVLDACLESFFSNYGKLEQEKIADIISSETSHKKTVKYLLEYKKEVLSGSTITPSHTEFVRCILKYPEITTMTNEDIAGLLQQVGNKTTKRIIINFLKFVREKETVSYGEIVYRKNEGNAQPAYSYEVYLKLSMCLFNADYIEEHQMIEKALHNHMFAEAWLYLSIFFCCGWRAQDVCRAWRYPNLAERNDSFAEINTNTLYEDILYDRLSEKTYTDICKYSIGAMEKTNAVSSKNSAFNPDFLHAVISPSLYPYYGLLTLIAEALFIRTGDGYMKECRTNRYQNKMLLKSFFGQEMWDCLGGRNIESKRLNKVFLQGVENSSRKNGCGSVLAGAVASYARGHKNLNTIKAYLDDGNLTGETAEFVLFEMLDIGVFGFEAYQTLATAFPEEVNMLPLRQRTELIKKMGTPLEIEQKQSELDTQYTVQEAFINGDKAQVLSVLESMFEITQRRGHGKDTGVYCLLRTKHEACSCPEWESCLANGCEHLVLTRMGIKPLISILNEYYEKAVHGDKKAEMVLKKILIPRYQDIINDLMQAVNMPVEDRKGLKKIMKGELKIG